VTHLRPAASWSSPAGSGDVVQVGLAIDHAVVMCHKVTDTDAERREIEDGEKDGTRDRTAPRLGVVLRVVAPTSKPPRTTYVVFVEPSRLLRQRPAGEMQEDVFE